MIRTILRLATAVVAVFFASSATAQNSCADLGATAQQLKLNYGELPTWRGLSGRGYMIVLFESADSKTWTIVMVRPDGLACPLDAGGRAQKLSTDTPS